MLNTIENIMLATNGRLLISSAGIISRCIYHVKDRPQNFYMMGSMGCALGVGLGLAMNTDKFVIVIAGDGEILMNLGTLVLANKLKLKNIQLIILDNNCFASTGGQPTCSDAVNFQSIYRACVVMEVPKKKPEVKRIPLEPEEISKRFMDAVRM